MMQLQHGGHYEIDDEIDTRLVCNNTKMSIEDFSPLSHFLPSQTGMTG